MRFGILGPLTVWRDGDEVDVGGPRVRLLLALLLVEAGRVVPASRLIDGLWGEDPPRGAANALQSHVSRLRSALSPDVQLQSRPEGYLLAVEPEAVDAGRFERLAGAGRRALTDGAPAQAARDLAEALALWRGDPLAGLLRDPALDAEATRLLQLRLAASADRLEAELRCGRAAAAIPELETIVAAHPLDERARGLLMRALRDAGRPADALLAFEEGRRALAAELGADPSPQLQRLHVEILRGEGGPEPLARPPTNLRTALTSFVGREDELRRVRELLEHHRLVTLTGAGGAGKTRLAMELGAARLEDLPDGVWFVELAPLTDPAAIPQAALAALGLREAALVGAEERRATEPLARLLEALAGKRLLLIVDNCEHLVEGAARIAEAVLAACPSVRVLATSREPLGVPGERLWQVLPLTAPDAARGVDDALAFSAVRLFADRARSVQPGFRVHAGNAGAVAQICRRLDGLPLAIELAAARVRTFEVPQIAARLDDRFALLTGGSRTALPRQQTLRAVVDWSWELLRGREPLLLRRLGVFSGGATLEAAEHVCAGEGLPEREVLGLLAGLVDKSLLEAEGDGEAMRYRLLETVRAYALERLDAAGETAAYRRRHAEWFARLAEAAEPELRGHEQLSWLARLDRERDNLRSALRFAVEGGDANLALRLASGSAGYWRLRGYRVEVGGWLAEALQLPGPVDPWLRATTLVAQVGNGPDMEPDQLQTRVAEIHALYHASGRPPHPGLTSVEVMAELFRGDFEGARAVAERVVADVGADPWARAWARTMTGNLLQRDAEGAAEATRRFAEAAAEFRSLGDRSGLSQTLASLAEVDRARGEGEQAERALEESLEQVRELGAREDATSLLIRLGGVRLALGKRAEGEASIEEGTRLARELGSPDTLAAAYFMQGQDARRRGDLTAARSLFEETERTAPPDRNFPPFRRIARISLGVIAELLGDADRAELLHRGVLEELRAEPSNLLIPFVVAAALDGLAGVAMLRGDPERAAELLGAAAARRRFELQGEERIDTDRIARAARDALGPAAFDEAYERGKAMSPEGPSA